MLNLAIMAKASKPKKKKGKYDITLQTNLSTEQLFKLAITTKPPKTKRAGK